MKRLAAVAAVIALVGLTATPAAALEGDGFTEQILTCVGDSNVTVNVPKGYLFMVRWAPECEPRDPIVFKVTKDRKVRVHSHKDGQAFQHTVNVDAR